MILNTDNINNEVKSVEDISNTTDGIILVKDKDKLLGYITWNSFRYTFKGSTECFPSISLYCMNKNTFSDINLKLVIKTVKEYFGNYISFDFLPIESRDCHITRCVKSMCKYLNG